MNRLLLLLGLWLGSLSANGQIDAVRYWFDNDFDIRTNFILNASNNLSYSRDIDVSALPDGLHALHIQFREDTVWTSVSSDIFFKVPTAVTGSALMQYWFDNQFENAQTINFSNTKTVSLISNISVSGLSDGLHTLHARFRPQGKEWTSVASDIFFTGTQAAGSEIVEFRYWYNHDSLSAKTIQVGNSTEFFFDIDIEGLTNGKHVFNGQFKDAKGRWTAVEKDTIQVGPIDFKNHMFPTITLSSANLGIGNTLTVSGSQFTLNGKVNMRIYPASGNGIILDSVVFAEYNGTVRMDYPLPPQLLKGDYIVSATDANTGRNTDARRFFVNGLVLDNTGSISVQTPAAGQKYMLGNSIIVLWRDKADYGYFIPGTGALNIRYKIEVQKDNGAWQTVKDTTVKGYKDQYSTFAYVYRPPAVGSYAFRVTNQETLNRVGVSGTGIVENQQGGVNVQFVWDYTVPDRENKNAVNPPIGVAADGTARFYIKVSPQAGNTKTIRNVEVKLRDASGPLHTPDKIGRIMWARGIYGYGLEGNEAKSTSATSGGASDNEGGHWFWYVAPDDFARGEIDHYSGSRNVIASIIVNYNDNTKEPLIEREIEVVRPPVMMVHGYGGDPTAWSEFSFSKGANSGSSEQILFINEWGKDKIFKFTYPVRIEPDESFERNAKNLLDVNPISNTLNRNISPNSFRGFIRQMIIKGYASARVDYVAHSMGGAAGRTAISQFPKHYLSLGDENNPYKNYKKGYVNKFITIQTPFNGSPFANLLDETEKYKRPHLYNIIYAIDPLLANSSYRMTANDYLGMPNFELSPVMEDMRFKYGYLFPTTTIKNHLIATQTLNTVIDGENALERSISAIEKVAYASSYYLLLKSLPWPFSKLFDLEKFLSKNSYEVPFFPNSDFVVGVSSQLAERRYIHDLTTSRFFGPQYWHMQSRKNLDIGNKVFSLLNSNINGIHFANEIQSNPFLNKPGSMSLQNEVFENHVNTEYFFDTSRIKIISPNSLNQVTYDTIMNVVVNIKDTSRLVTVEVLYQGNIYTSESKIPVQNFAVETNPFMPGHSRLLAVATYDSTDKIIKHIDSVSLVVSIIDSVFGLYVEPKIKRFLPNSTPYLPRLFVNHSSHISLLNMNDSGIQYVIKDTNVISINSRMQILPKDSGSTEVIYSFNGFTDTLLVIIESGEDLEIVNNPENKSICSMQNAFFSVASVPGSTYQWQLDSGNGYTNLTNNGLYKGVTKDTLWLNQPPSSMAGYRYRCLVTNSKGSTYTLPAFLRFSTTWTGAADSAWENAGNWTCGMVPDEFTDVIIPEKTNMPKVNTDVKCRSLLVSPGSTIQIQPGKKLEVNGKDWDFQY